MITSVLSAAVVWCMFYGRLSAYALALLCAALGITIAFLGRHKHTQFLAIDVLAQISRLNTVNPALKLWGALALMGVCISARSPAVGLLLAAAMLVLTVFAGGLALSDYAALLAAPVSFLMLSGLALLFEVSAAQAGVINIPIFGYWLSVSPGTQLRTELVVSRALGAVSCLYLLSLTTPMSELIGVLRRARCPNILISLMYLTYRYIFILLTLYHTMRNAAESRLGSIDYAASLRTAGSVFGSLLAASYRRAGRNFDAMESRCFDTEIRFLESEKRVTAAHACVAAGLVFITLGLTILTW